MSKLRNPEALTYALDHHAKEIRPLVHTLGLEILTRLTPLGWTIHQSRKGANSFWITDGDMQYHFRAMRLTRGGPVNAIQVREFYYRGRVVTVLTSRKTVLEFIAAVETGNAIP
jgi:hypothetical protein